MPVLSRSNSADSGTACESCKTVEGEASGHALRERSVKVKLTIWERIRAEGQAMHFDERVVTGEMTRAEARAYYALRANRARWTQTPTERFWGRVKKSDGCWEWQGDIRHGKYGRFTVGRTNWPAHRYAWFITNGDIPDGQYVCHACDNKKCVRPEHLFLGTQTDNMRDARAKGIAYRPGQHGKQGPGGKFVKKERSIDDPV